MTEAMWNLLVNEKKRSILLRAAIDCVSGLTDVDVERAYVIHMMKTKSLTP